MLYRFVHLDVDVNSYMKQYIDRLYYIKFRIIYKFIDLKIVQFVNRRKLCIEANEGCILYSMCVCVCCVSV